MVTFKIPGKPVPKARPRLGRHGTYTPQATVQAEKAVQWVAGPLFKEPMVGPVELIVVAKFAPPKSWSKKKTAAHIGQPHLQKPDFDNIAKLVSDALNGIAYKDDSQICYGVVQKRWADVAETVVTVTTCHVENIVGSGI